MNRRIASALILTLLLQAFLPGAAASQPATARAQFLLICTGDGLAKVALGAGAAERSAPEAQQCCSCGLVCGPWALGGIERFGARIAYVASTATWPQAPSATPIAGRLPPGQPSRAPPSSS